MRKVLPWLTNVSVFSCLFSGGDLLQQRMKLKNGREVDWKRTRNVALVAFCLHGNWHYFWLRMLERRLPGRSLGMVLSKLVLDQSFSAPLAICMFYTGVRVLEGKEDVLKDCREKSFNTYKTGLMYWPIIQFLNFMFMPLYLRTVSMGCAAFLRGNGFTVDNHREEDCVP